MLKTGDACSPFSAVSAGYTSTMMAAMFFLFNVCTMALAVAWVVSMGMVFFSDFKMLLRAAAVIGLPLRFVELMAWMMSAFCDLLT